MPNAIEIIGLISSRRPGMVTVCCTTWLITVAFVALDHWKMASPGDGDRNFGIHALWLREGAIEKRAQAIGSRQPLSHGTHVGAAGTRRRHLGILGSSHAWQQLKNAARRSLGAGHQRTPHKEKNKTHCNDHVWLRHLTEQARTRKTKTKSNSSETRSDSGKPRKRQKSNNS